MQCSPKSSSMPPGLCEAERINAPKALKPPSRDRTTADAAGVESCVIQPTEDQGCAYSQTLNQTVFQRQNQNMCSVQMWACGNTCAGIQGASRMHSHTADWHEHAHEKHGRTPQRLVNG